MTTYASSNPQGGPTAAVPFVKSPNPWFNDVTQEANQQIQNKYAGLGGTYDSGPVAGGNLAQSANQPNYVNRWGGPVWGGNAGAVDSNGNFIQGSDAASQDVARYQGLAAYDNQRTTPYADLSQYNGAVGMANSGYTLGTQDRGSQLGALALAQQAATGNAPSAAQSLQQNTLDQGFQQQLAAGAGARGGAMAQAAAQRSAAQGGAAYYQTGANNIGAMRAQEMATAQQNYGNQASGIRAQDYTAGSLGNSIAQTTGDMANQQVAQQLQNRQINDQGQQYYEGQAFNTNQAQLGAAEADAALYSGNSQFAQSLALQKQQQQNQLIGSYIGAGATGGASYLNNSLSHVGQRATGGPVAAGQPYLVGERGPELIIPSGNATVMPADNPMSLGAVAARYPRSTTNGSAPVAMAKPVSLGDVAMGRY